MDHVGARLLQRAGPADVAALVEAGLELDHAHRLLAALGRPDQSGDQRRLVVGAIHGQLDRQHVGVRHRLVHEALHAGGERLVRLVDQEVARAHRLEHVGLLALLGVERTRDNGGPGRIAQLRVPLLVVQLPQVGEVQHALDLVHLALLHLEPLHEPLAHVGVHRGADLQPDHLAEAPAAELLLHGLEQVIGLVRDREVGVARHAEHGVVEDLHAREQLVEVAGDHVLERHERPAADGDEPWQHLLRHLHAREGLGLGHRVADPHRHAQRQVRDVREWPAGADGEWGERGEDLLAEDPVHAGLLLLIAGVAGDHAQALLRELRADARFPLAGLPRGLGRHPLHDPLDRLRGAQAVGTARVDPGLHLVVQAGDANHEELVLVRSPDGEELGALQQRHLLVLGQLEHAVVEVEPGELAVGVERRVVESPLLRLWSLLDCFSGCLSRLHALTELTFDAIPEASAFQAGPVADELRVEHVAAALKVCGVRLEARVAAAVGGVAYRGRLQVLGSPPGQPGHRRAVLPAKALDMGEHARHALVAVVDLA